MKLENLLNEVDIIKSYGDFDRDISGIAYDSRKVTKDGVFVCITGFKTDGHRFIQSAIDNGAAALIIERDIENTEMLVEDNRISIIRVKDSRQALSKLAANFYDNPSERFKVVGITGTNGKTSITYLVSNILEANNKRTSLIGTIKSKILNEEYKVANTTPESVELQYFFNEMVKKDIDVCTMEVSSHSLDLKRVEDISFNIGVFTNLTADHLDFHKDMESYKSAKVKLFYKAKDANIINTDDRYGKEIYEEIKKLDTPVLSYGTNSSCDIYTENIDMHASYSEFDLVTPRFTGKVRINIPGLFSIYNILAAISVCYALGYSFEEISKGIKSIEPVRGRFETVDNDKGIGVIVDYAHTPDALKNVLETVNQFVKGNTIVVFGCGGDRDGSKRHVMGKIAYDLSDYAIITNDNPRTEDPEKIVSDIMEGIGPDKEKYEIVMDRKEAIRRAIERARKDDIILIAGKGHETYQIINDEVFDFDDKEVALEFLKTN
ncbi:UDP-N-acetylmuramoyl-L-alanyl-D-glutamate--2,6-diaminopimelate ligase [Wukongibacter sp. M2B1]|uniref:UDP-N-acetylmuramoyl-L-alanyl-D-glutamate--2, 6-diaminopimelate ligase n=1 Tax=Wukongibacter sp. M2B1 TaxID=3088895 RepID=UPI003D7A8F3F